MPNEMRKIDFSLEELQAALVNFALRTQKKLPNATIDSISVEGKDAVSAIIQYIPQGTEEAKSVDFSPNDLAAALILYCSSQQIPLPKESKKSVIPVDNSVGMIIKLDYSELTPGIRPSGSTDTQ